MNKQEKKYDVAVFDVDGTLLNTKEGVLKAVRDMLKKCGLRELKTEEEPLFIGPPIQESLMKVYGVSKEEAQSCAEVFRDLYKQDDYLLRAFPYDGIMQLMKDLEEHGIKVAVATYKRHDYAQKICEHFGFTKYADAVYGSDNFNKLKKLDIIELCLKDMKVSDYKRAVMIRDTSFDAIGAKEIGTEFIGVTYGYGFISDEEVNEYPNIGIAHTAEEILPYFM